MNVLSLFDGMSCGQIALNNLGVKVHNYYASEIDKYAIRVTKTNYKNTIHLGDINKWGSWRIDWKNIDLVLAGSPCQGFSFAGKQLAFNDERSILFFVFIDVLNHIKSLNPNVKFLLENVQMKKEHLRIISEYVGIFPCNIDSTLVSAQNRNRWYWSNIRTKRVGLFEELYTDIPQPKDEGILLKDIFQPKNEINNKYYLSDKMHNYLNTRKANFNSGKINIKTDKDKASCINASSGSIDISDNLIIQRARGFNKGGEHIDKSPPITSNSWDQNNVLKQGYILRRLTPIECERLQTIPYNYTSCVSDTQRYKMLGNGWTVKVIEHILSYL